MSLKERLLDFIRKEAYKPLTLEELVVALDIKEKKEAKRFKRLLKDLESRGEIVQTRFKRYGVPEKMNLVVGQLQGHAQGYGFVIPEEKGSGDIFISANNINGAMHRDRVIARTFKKTGGKKIEGEIIRIIKRNNTSLVGTYEASRNFGFVVPDDHRVFQDVFIPRGMSLGARSGDKVVTEITRWPEKRRNPQGKVTELLGNKNLPGVDILSIIRKFELPEEFPPEVLSEAEALPEEISGEEYGAREDFRDRFIITIDDQEAKDLDDAVSLEKDARGSYRLGVYIADVGHYVKEGSFLDREACRRGTSVYLVDRVIPMLPPRLSNQLCSLNPRVDRLTLGATIDLDPSGKVVGSSFHLGVINTRERMTYQKVNQILEEKDPESRETYRELVPMLENMEELACRLKDRRAARGSLGFQFPETYIKLDSTGKPEDVGEKKRGIGESMIEEFMIVCNEAVARHFFELKVPFLYRVHPDPDEEKVAVFRDYIANFGYTIKGDLRKLHPAALQSVLEKARGKPEERVVHTILLRSMKLACYSPVRERHFGLASQYYSHFTSPIRRYPDLAIHRIIREVLNKGGLSKKYTKKLNKNLPEVADHSSAQERVAMEAERETQDLKKVEYMERWQGHIFPAIVTSVTHFGIFVMLENTVEGLVHVSSMDDDFYHFVDKQFTLVGEQKGRSFRIGDRVKVQVSRVDREERNIDFILVENS